MPSASGHQGKKGGGGPPTQQHLPAACSRGMGGTPDHTRVTGPMMTRGLPSPSSVHKPPAGKRGRRTDCARPRHTGQAPTKGGTPLNGSMRSQRTECPIKRTKAPRDSRKRRGYPPQQRVLPAHGMQGRGEASKPRDRHMGIPGAACAPSARHAGTGRRGGGHHQARRRGGGTPRAGAHALRARPDTGDGGKLPRPEKPPPPMQDEARGRG